MSRGSTHKFGVCNSATFVVPSQHISFGQVSQTVKLCTLVQGFSCYSFVLFFAEWASRDDMGIP